MRGTHSFRLLLAAAALAAVGAAQGPQDAAAPRNDAARKQPPQLFSPVSAARGFASPLVMSFPFYSSASSSASSSSSS
jgi:hypothetical protein